MLFRAKHSPDRSHRRVVLARLIASAALVGFLVACGSSSGAREPEGKLGDGDGTYNPPPAIPAAQGVYAADLEDLRAGSGATDGAAQLFFTVPSDKGPVTRYDVRQSVPHLYPDPASPGYAGNAATATYVGTPVSPGAAQSLTVSGLEPGQTVQLAVRAIYASGAGEFSHGVGIRVPGRPMPNAPANATQLSAPGTISTPGYYVLTQNVTAPGIAFTIAARGVTLDLNGNTVTFGTNNATGTSAIYAEYLYNDGATVIRNGTLRQGGTGSDCSGIHMRGGHDIRFSELTIQCQGPDSTPIVLYDRPSGHLRIDHCTISTTTQTVVNRHFPGVAAIAVSDILKSCEIDHNTVTDSPQWGLKIHGNETTAPGCWIHHNKIVGTSVRVANGYMIGVYKKDADVFENECHGESRGIHIDGEFQGGTGARVHDNWVRAMDRPNAEYATHWAHGLRVEAAADAQVYQNNVLVEGDEDHAEAIGLGISMANATDVVVRHNRIRATSNWGPFLAKAYAWVGGADGAPPASVDVHHNVFESTDIAIAREWPSLAGGPSRDNVWLRDLAKGAGWPFSFEKIDISNEWPSSGHRIINPLTDLSLDEVRSWAEPAAWDSERWFTMRIMARNASDAPVGGASVTVEDRDGDVVATATTDVGGNADVNLKTSYATNGPIDPVLPPVTIVQRGPFLVRVQRTGVGTYAGTHAVSSRVALRVRLAGTSSATEDATDPEGPATLWAHALSATRMRVRCSEATDDSGIVAYLIQLNDEAAAISAVPEAFLGGLSPNTRYEVCVRAVDAAGNISAPIGPVVVTTWADDRGR